MQMAPRWTLLCAGLWMLVALVTGQFTEEQQLHIVQLHNVYRSKVVPEAANMAHMMWGEELALVAEAYAAKCIWDHNPDLQNSIGENLFISTGTFSVDKAMTDWFEEHEDYVYENNTCPEDKMCGHYTQIVWATTTRVGCAAHLCETVEGLDFKKATLLVCNYSPPGNVIGHKPYVAGVPCSQCPEDMPECVDSVCSSIDRSELPTLEPTEAWWTETPITWSVEGSGSNKSPAALLLLTGLLASLLWI